MGKLQTVAMAVLVAAAPAFAEDVDGDAGDFPSPIVTGAVVAADTGSSSQGIFVPIFFLLVVAAALASD